MEIATTAHNIKEVNIGTLGICFIHLRIYVPFSCILQSYILMFYAPENICVILLSVAVIRFTQDVQAALPHLNSFMDSSVKLSAHGEAAV